MPELNVFNVGGLELYKNPLSRNDADLIESVNVYSDFYGNQTKRPGLITYLGTADGSAVNSLFTFGRNDGTTFYNYRASGSLLYYSLQGTSSWAICGNGTISPGAHVGNAILGNTMIIGDGVGSTRHTTNGTSFTDTVLAPIADSFAQYQNRIFANGTAGDLFYSTTGDATNWLTSGTSDSSSISIPGAGKNGKIFRAVDRLIITKNSQLMYRWDGFALVDMSTNKGPSSPYCIDSIGDYWFWQNSDGLYGYQGAVPQIIGNSVSRFYSNTYGTPISGTAIGTIPAATHQYDYFSAMGTVADDFSQETINDAVLKYDFLQNQFTTYSYPIKPTTFLSYKDENGNQQFLIGASNGQVYQQSAGTYSDDGTAIESRMQFFTHCGAPFLRKKFNFLDLFFNPGCQARVQYAITNNFSAQYKQWKDFQKGTMVEGHNQYRFEVPINQTDPAVGKFLFVRITEKSTDKPFSFYGYSVTFELMRR